jgi:AraC-like DNA-binding protein
MEFYIPENRNLPRFIPAFPKELSKFVCNFGRKSWSISDRTSLLQHVSSGEDYSIVHAAAIARCKTKIGIYVEEGSVYMLSMITGSLSVPIGKTRSTTIYQGQFCFFSPAAGISEIIVSPGEYEIIVWSISPSFYTNNEVAFEMLRQSHVSQNRFWTKSRLTPEMLSIINQIKQSENSAIFHHEKLMLNISLLNICGLVRIEEDEGLDSGDTATSIKEWIDLNIKEPEKISIQSLVRSFNISVSTLRRLFQEKYGVSTLQYIQQNRCRLVKRYIQQSSSKPSIMFLAFEFGYTDPKALTKIFKKTFGVSPIEYWKKYHSENERNDQRN